MYYFKFVVFSTFIITCLNNQHHIRFNEDHNLALDARPYVRDLLSTIKSNSSVAIPCSNNYESCSLWPKNCTADCAKICCSELECILLPFPVLNLSSNSSEIVTHGPNSTGISGIDSLTAHNHSNSCACIAIHCAGSFDLSWDGLFSPLCAIACSLSENGTTNTSGNNCSVVCCGSKPTCAAATVATATNNTPTTVAAESSKVTATPLPTVPPASSPPPPPSSPATDGGQVVVRNNITVVNITTVVTEYVRNSSAVGAQEELNRLVDAFRRFFTAPVASSL